MLRSIGPIALLALAAFAVIPAQARIVRLDILEETPFADSMGFGDAGPYLRIRAIAHGTLDPADPANAAIALIDKAPRNAAGLVEYQTEITILRPADPNRGSRVMLYDVLNRGNKYVPSWLNDAREPPGGMLNDPRTAEDAGNGFAFRRGYTIVWSAWQADVPTANAGMAMHLPVATENGRPLTRRIRVEIVQGTRSPENVRVIPLPYPTANIEGARLTVRRRETDPRQDLPADTWRWMDKRTIQLMPFGTTPRPRSLYDLFYEATDPTIPGIGFAAVRDVVADLRMRTGVSHVLGFGVSLSGRFLRHFLDLGMNRDEAGQRVFDGLLPHIAGAGKVFANESFAMPGRTATAHEDRFYPEVWPPYAHTAPGGLLRDPATDPKIIETNTATEYWQKAASAVHTDAAGNDAPLHPNVRMTLFAGIQHGGHAGTPATPGACASPRNPTSAGPALRAALVALEDWVVRGTPPPETLVPRRADRTGIPVADIRMPAVPGIRWATTDNPVGTQVDWTDPPARPVDPMPTFVPAVDADGNETAGLRLPHLAVPLGTYTGVNTYRDIPGTLCDRDGIYLPFAATRAERERTGDPRPSLQERYRGRDDYVARLTAAADTLVAARRLLPEDRDRMIATARQAPGFTSPP